MTQLTRQIVLDALSVERVALLTLLARIEDEVWQDLTREDGWCVHDIVAHVADQHLGTVAISGVAARPEWATVGVTLPMQADGRINRERLNMLRYQLNRHHSRKDVMTRLDEGFRAVGETVEGLDEQRLAGPGPYGQSETMLEWFFDTVEHNREHRLELERILKQASD